MLIAVLDRGQPLEEAFERHASGVAGPDERDRRFVRALVVTTLRRLGQIDGLIRHCVPRPLPKRAEPVRHILRLGAAQLVFLKTPAHAAVDTSVRLARARRMGHHLALVNAVLRRLAREGAELAAAQDAQRLNTPRWLWQAWIDAYGEPTARAMAEAHLGEAPLDLTPRGDAAAAARMLGARLLPTGTLRLAQGGPVPALPGYADGAWWVQDAAAALPVRLFGPVAGQRVIDLCAAPGGKTAQLAEAGAQVTAVDRAEDRLARVRENLTRLALPAEVITADALEWRPAEPADAVLVDAPCSATGTVRRHPDVPRHKRPADVVALAQVQTRLLAAAAEMVRPGGVVVYCACSLQPEEGPGQVAALRDAGIPLVLEPVGADVVAGLAELIDGDGALRTRPDMWHEHGGLDGFYAARLRRDGA